MSSVLRVVRTRESLQAAYGEIPQPAIRSARATRAAVFTMGALHEGHLALIRAARGEVGPGGHLTVTIFVNPLQFGPGEDLDLYPRDLKADIELCAAEDVDLVFAPPTEMLYPNGEPDVRVTPGPLGDVLEGASRPGHFSGMLTVVLKLLNLTRPDATFFGEKDYQQLTLVRRMVADFDLDVKVHAVPTLREQDGLARSSRNRYLSPEQRELAAAIPNALAAGVTAADLGRPADAVVGAAELELARAGLMPDYVALTSPDLGHAPVSGPARLLVACPVGSTRLIDNTPVVLRR
jgi:pantoate--beta-alanine ligase